MSAWRAPRRLRPTVLAADLAVSDRDQPVLEHAARRQSAATHRDPDPRPDFARADRRQRRSAMAGTISGHAAGQPRRPGARSRGPLRDHRGDLARVHHRPATAAGAAARRTCAARCSWLPRERGRQDARRHPGIGSKRPQTSPGHGRQLPSGLRQQQARAPTRHHGRTPPRNPADRRPRTSRPPGPGRATRQGRPGLHAARDAGVPGNRRRPVNSSQPPPSGPTGPTGWCRPAPTASRRSACIWPIPTQVSSGPTDCLSSRSPATASARSPASTRA